MSGRTAPPSSSPPSTGGLVHQPTDLEEIRALRQPQNLTDPDVVQAAVATLDCAAPDPLAGLDDPDLPLITCDQTSGAIYALGPTFLTGTDINTATTRKSEYGPHYDLVLTFTTQGTAIWADYTAAHVGQLVAIVLDTEVLSAPEIQGAITGETVISGTNTKEEAEALARRITG